MTPTPAEKLVLARDAAGISQQDLWMRYFALGGMSPPLELDAIVHAALSTSAQDWDLIVLALNERFRELGRDGSIAYSDQSPCAPDASDPLGAEGCAIRERVDHAYRDELTGALPRDAGRDQLHRSVNQAHRTHHPLALVFLDVDHLKLTNDTHGHAAGDQLLRALGDALRQNLRSYDVVVRYGGDEFVCALPHAGLAQATARVEHVSERLQATVRGASVSAGFAALREEDSLDDLVRRADRDMYANRGRCRSLTTLRQNSAATAPPTLPMRVLQVLSGLIRRAVHS